MSAKVSTARLIPAVILAILVYGMIAAMLGTLLPQLAERFGLSDGDKGMVALAQALGLMIASVSVGPLIDNKGKKTGLVLGLGTVAAVLFVLPNSTGFGMLATLMFLLGLGGGIIVTAANALVSDVSEERRAALFNLVNLFFGLGGLLTPAVAGFLFADNTIGLAYLVAVLTAVTFAVHAITPMPPPTGERGFKSSEAGAVLGRPVLWLLALFNFLYVGCEVGVWNWLTSYLVSRGVPEASALKILSLGFALGLLVGRVAVSPILIKVRAATVTLWAAVLMAITTFVMLQTADPVTAGAAVFLTGIAMAPVFPTTLAMVGDVFPRMTATAMGIVITSGWIGSAVTSPVIGRIADATSLGTALLLLPAFSVVMVVVNLALRPLTVRKSAGQAA